MPNVKGGKKVLALSCIAEIVLCVNYDTPGGFGIDNWLVGACDVDQELRKWQIEHPGSTMTDWSVRDVPR